MTQPETPAVWIDGHPQLEAIAAAVWEQCGRSDSGMCVEDDPRNIAVAAFAAVLPASAGRAAVLTEAADVADRLMDERYGPDCSYAIGGEVVATELRRLAAEAHDGDTQDDRPAFSVQVWPLARVLAEVRCGSEDWTWDEEWADLDRRHARSGYLSKLEQEIRENGITMPVLIGTDGRLWDGHHRLRIAVRLGIDYVPVEVPAASAVPLVGSAEPAHDEPCGGRSHREHLARECPVVRYGERCACDEPVTEEQDRG